MLDEKGQSKLSSSTDYTYVIEDPPESEDDDAEKKPNEEQAHSGGSMTIYMVTKTIQWVTRAKVNAWFRLAFNLSGSEHSSRSATPTFTSSPSQQRTDLIMRRRSHTGVTTAKKFYELEAKDPKERGLTLEPRYKFSTPDLPPTRFDSKTVPTMMRRSSGFWSEEFTQRVHETLFKESMEMTRATSEMQLKENVEK